MSDKLPPCDHDECGPSKCSKLSDTPRTDAAIRTYESSSSQGLNWDYVQIGFARTLERENNQLQTKLVIAETTCDELSPLIEKNNQLRAELKQCAEAILKFNNLTSPLGTKAYAEAIIDLDESLSLPHVQAALKEVKGKHE